MIKLIVFDWNGVIVDSFNLDRNIFVKAVRSAGIKVSTSKKFYRSLYEGNILDRFLEIGLTEDQIRNGSEYKKLYMKNMSRSRPFPGIINVLKKIRKSCKTALVTANYREVVNKWIDDNSFSGVFDSVLTIDDNHRKEENIKKLLEKFRLNKNEVFYVGDTISDIMACRNIGIKIIAATWGYHNEESLKKNNPDLIARKPGDLLRILKGE